MTLTIIVHGDAVFHGRGRCFACHGAKAEGLPAAGSPSRVGVNFIPWTGGDRLADRRGIPEVVTRSPIHMPPRGARGDLTAEEIRDVAAYVWAISQVRGRAVAGRARGARFMIPAGSTAGHQHPPALDALRPPSDAPAPAREDQEVPVADSG